MIDAYPGKKGRSNQITKRGKQTNKMRMRVKKNKLGFGNLCTEVFV